jgi:hypothetical protein
MGILAQGAKKKPPMKKEATQKNLFVYNDKCTAFIPNRGSTQGMHTAHSGPKKSVNRSAQPE